MNLNNIFFTADTHFSHKLMAKMRGFGTPEAPDLKLMDETLISNWNSVVKEKDVVYHLGDVSWLDQYKTSDILSRLNGVKYLILGNHDWQMLKIECKKHFQWIKERHELKFDFNGISQTIILDHYPMLSWNKAFHGSWQLFGHVHGKNPGVGLSMDVGVDCHDLKSISLKKIMEIMSNKINHEKNQNF
jgi:calcineurin-like phosphoesterase family protein